MSKTIFEFQTKTYVHVALFQKEISILGHIAKRVTVIQALVPKKQLALKSFVVTFIFIFLNCFSLCWGAGAGEPRLFRGSRSQSQQKKYREP